MTTTILETVIPAGHEPTDGHAPHVRVLHNSSEPAPFSVCVGNLWDMGRPVSRCWTLRDAIKLADEVTEERASR